MFNPGNFAHAYDMMIHGQTILAATGPPGLVFDNDTTATIQAGFWVDLLGQVLIGGFGIVWTWFVVTYVPFWMKPLLNNIRVDKLFTNAVYMAISKAKDAGDIAPDGTVLVDMHNKYLDDILVYVANNSDALLKQWIGTNPTAMIDKAKSFLERILASNLTNYKPAMVVTPTAMTSEVAKKEANQ